VHEDWRPRPGQLALIEPVATDDGDGRVTGLVQSGGAKPVIDIGGEPKLPAPECEVVASFYAPDALYRMQATAVTKQANRGLVGLKVHRVERVQRREHERTRTALPVEFTASDGTRLATGTTVDVAPGGLGLTTEAPLPRNSKPKVSVTLPDGMTVTALARVLEAIQQDGQYRYRVAFSEIEDHHRDALIDLTRKPAPDR